MKKTAALLLVLLCLMASAAAEDGHEHIFGEWSPSESGHSAVCAEDGETLTAPHYNFTVHIGGFSGSVCGVCGLYPGGVLPLIGDAQAVSLKAKPSKQRGGFIVRGMASPFAEAPEVLFAFTAAYIQNGALATWKDVSTVTVPLGTVLQGPVRLLRVQGASGDDSVQNPETHIEMEFALDGDVLTFSGKTPALYLLVEGPD